MTRNRLLGILMLVVAFALVAAAVRTCRARSAPTPPPLGTDAAGNPLPAFARARLGPEPLPFAVRGVAISADKSRVVLAAMDGWAWSLDLDKGTYRQEFQFHEPGPREPLITERGFRSMFSHRPNVRAFRAAAFDAAAQTLVAGDDHEVVLWDVATGNAVERWKHNTMSLAVSGDGKSVAVASHGLDRSVTVHRVGVTAPAQKVATIYPHGLALDERGGLLAVCSSSLSVHDLETGAILCETEKQPFARPNAAFSPDGALIAHEQGVAGEVVLRRAADGTQIWRIASGWTSDLVYAPDGRHVVDTPSGRVLEAETGQLVRTLLTAPDTAWKAAYSSDGALLALAGRQGVRVFSTTDWTEPFTLPWNAGPLAGTGALAFSAEGREVYTVFGGGVLVWDAQTGLLLRTFTGLLNAPYRLAVSAGGRVALLGRGDISAYGVKGPQPGDDVARAPLVVIDGQTGEVRERGDSHSLGSLDVAFVGEEVLLLDVRDDALVVRNVTTGVETRLRQIGAKAALYPHASFGPGARTVLFRDAVFDLPGGAQRTGLAGLAANDVQLAADSDVLLAYQLAVRVQDAHDGSVLLEVEAQDPHTGSSAIPMAISPDGKLVAFSMTTTTAIAVWSVPERRSLVTLRGHTDGIQTLRFSPDGATLASSSHDGTVLLWNLTQFR